MNIRTVGAGVIFVTVLLAYTVQTSLVQYVQYDKEYVQPYFLLWLTHSGYFLCIPIQLLATSFLPNTTRLAHLVAQVQDALSDHLTTPRIDRKPPSQISDRLDDFFKFPALRFARLILLFACLVACPALCWFIAVRETSITDLTAIYNSNAFWAYVLAIYVGKTERWEVKKIVAVSLACCGVIVIAYGDSGSSSDDGGGSDEVGLGMRLIGNLFALGGAIAFAFYEIWYQKYIALRSAGSQSDSDNDHVYDKQRPSPMSRPPSASRRTSARFLLENAETGSRYTSFDGNAADDHEEMDVPITPKSPRFQRMQSSRSQREADEPSYLSSDGSLDNQVFLAHANFTIGCVGIATFICLWVPIPILHFIGWERFYLPPDHVTYLAIFGSVVAGVFFNAGFVMLVSLYGPVMASVGNLCTLVLVAVLDWLRGKANFTLPVLIGCGLIVAGFAILSQDVFKQENHGRESEKDVAEDDEDDLS